MSYKVHPPFRSYPKHFEKQSLILTFAKPKFCNYGKLYQIQPGNETPTQVKG